MNKKMSIKSLAYSLILITFSTILQIGCSAPSDPSTQKPNVVVIVSDALRQDVLGCYGGDADTPNLDWLAKNGVLFENAYSTSPWTAPSAVSMFTGNYATTYGYSPHAKTRRIGPIRIYVPGRERLLAEALSQDGYDTAMMIENINASMHNNLQGFESIPDSVSLDHVAEKIKRITGGEAYDSPAYKVFGDTELMDSPAYQHSFAVLRHLLELKPDVNFFLLHWMLDPHYPYDPVEKFNSQIEVDESALPQEKRIYSRVVQTVAGLSNTEQRYVRDLYTKEVESVDERVGFIVETLKQKRLIDNTYIVFTSDHGEHFGEHGLFGHGGHGLGCHYYEDLVKVPLIVFGPELPKGKRVKDNVSNLDLMPTLKDLLGIEYEEDMQGQSYKALMFGDSSRGGVLYFDDVRTHEQIDALLDDNFKLISLKDRNFELYHLAEDGDEKENIASSQADRVASMYDAVLKLRKTNSERQKKNIAALNEDDLREFSEQEKQDIIKKLKALGYIQ
jgi:arylsulfatase A-like enzyme